MKTELFLSVVHRCFPGCSRDTKTTTWKRNDSSTVSSSSHSKFARLFLNEPKVLIYISSFCIEQYPRCSSHLTVDELNRPIVLSIVPILSIKMWGWAGAFCFVLFFFRNHSCCTAKWERFIRYSFMFLQSLQLFNKMNWRISPHPFMNYRQPPDDAVR